jgi:hypothetical protein
MDSLSVFSTSIEKIRIALKRILTNWLFLEVYKDQYVNYIKRNTLKFSKQIMKNDDVV